MKTIVTSLALFVFFALGVNAQERGDWYVGTGDIANKAWTDWSVAPTVGYGVTNELMVGVNVSQSDSANSAELDIHARYFWNEFFVYAQPTGLSTDDLKIGFGKMFTFHKGIYVDPKVVRDLNNETTNLMLGVGLKF